MPNKDKRAKDYIRKYLPIVRRMFIEKGVTADPKAFVIQTGHESGWGGSSLTSKYNNFGGYKASKSDVKSGNYILAETNEYLTDLETEKYKTGGVKELVTKTDEFKINKNGDVEYKWRVKAPFKKFKSIEEGLSKNIDLISNPRYSEAGTLNSKGNPQQYFDAMLKGGYATDPNYSKKLMNTYQSFEKDLNDVPVEDYSSKPFEPFDKKYLSILDKTQAPMMTKKQKIKKESDKFFKSLPGSKYVSDPISKTAAMFRYGGMVKQYQPGGMAGGPDDPPYKTNLQNLYNMGATLRSPSGVFLPTNTIQPIQMNTTGGQQGLNIAASNIYDPNSPVPTISSDDLVFKAGFDLQQQRLKNANENYDFTGDPMFGQGLDLNNNLVRKGGGIQPQFMYDGNPMQPYVDLFSDNTKGNPMQPYIDLFSGDQPTQDQIQNTQAIVNTVENEDIDNNDVVATDTTKMKGLSSTTKKKNKLDKADFYHHMMLGTDIGMFIQNALQQPPPRQDFSRTSLSRVDVDMTPFDVERSKQQEMINRAARSYRETLGQGADFMKATQGLSVKGQEGLRNIESAQRQALDKERIMNVEISNKEQMINDQQRDKEMQTNYGLMAQFYAQRSDALSKSVDAIRQDLRNMADYDIKKDYIKRQENLSRETAKRQDALNMLVALKEMSKSAEADPMFQNEVSSRKNKIYQDVQLEMNKKYGMQMPDEFQTKNMERIYAAQMGKLEASKNTLGEMPDESKYNIDEPKIKDFGEPQLSDYKDDKFPTLMLTDEQIARGISPDNLPEDPMDPFAGTGLNKDEQEKMREAGYIFVGMKYGDDNARQSVKEQNQQRYKDAFYKVFGRVPNQASVRTQQEKYLEDFTEYESDPGAYVKKRYDEAMAQYNQTAGKDYKTELDAWNKKKKQIDQDEIDLRALKETIDRNNNYINEYKSAIKDRGVDRVLEDVRKERGLQSQTEITKQLLEILKNDSLYDI